MRPQISRMNGLPGDATRMDRRAFVLRGAAIGLAVTGGPGLLSACGSSNGGSGAARAPVDAITVATDSFKSVDPAFAEFFSDLMADHAVFEGLIGYRPGTYEIENQLAETFEASEDGKQFHFRLKQGIQFHEGFGEVTAEDVKFSFERIAGMTKPVVQSAYVADWAPQLREVRIEGKYEGTIILKHAFAPMMRTTLPALSGLVVCKKAVLERGKRFGSRPIGSGPYQVESFSANRNAVLKRFADWGGASGGGAKPAFETITITAAGDPTFVDASLRSGDFDVALVEGTVLKRVKSNTDVSVEEITSLGYEWIGMNVKDPALSDINVRKAIRLAIDVPAIVSTAYRDAAERATAVIPPTMGVGYWEDAPVYDRDVEQAKSLLSTAGASGLKLSLAVPNIPAYFKTIAELVQANLAEVDIDVSIEVQDSATFFAPSAETLEKLQLFGANFGSFPDPFWSTQWFTTDQIGPGGYNWMSWSNPDFDALNQQAARELDEAKRTEIYVRMQRIWDEDANVVWLAWPKTIWAADKDIAMKIRPDGLPVVQAFAPAS